MAEANDILKQVKNVWINLGSGQKVAAGGITFLVFMGILAAAFLGGSPDYKQLVTQVAPKDLPGILSQLDDAGISDYKIIPSSKSIHVKSSDYDEARNMLYRSGMLKGESGDDESGGMFGSGGGMNREERNRNWNLSTEKRLAKRLESLGYIDKATVTITGKKKVYYKSGKEQAKAMVMVKIHDDYSKDQVKTIAYMVANGVESLSADAVTVSDFYGQILKKPSKGDDTEDQESRLAYQSQLEQQKIAKVQGLLDKVYGRDKVYLVLDVSLDWTRSNKIEKKFDTEGKVVREKTTQESTKPVGSNRNGGAPGSNAVEKGGAGAGATIAKELTKKESADFGFTESKVVTMGGAITRMTASVFIDESLGDQKDELKQTVAGAIGIDLARGDKIDVSVQTIAGPQEIATEPESGGIGSNPDMMMFYVRNGIYVFLGLIFIFFALRTIKKAQADLRSVLEASLEEEQKTEPVAPLTLEETVLETATRDADLAGRSLKRWLYEGAGAAE